MFDAYGTLLDIASPVADEADALGSRAGELSALWRRKQLEYTWLRALMRRHADFAEVTADALDHTLAAMGIADLPLRARLLAAYRRLAPFADVRPALRAPEGAGHADRHPVQRHDGHARRWRSAPPGLPTWSILCCPSRRSACYKPAPEVYRLATSRLGLPAAEIAFVSANGWDVHGAASFGLRSIWVNRGRSSNDRLPGSPARVIDDLACPADPALRGTSGAPQ